ncbi:PIR Superfamily Protein [Plasmodium ovale wallikeri]|uniref:PIR Superfamily Protein n=2 Tax=Plasmodium ovale TaxID=36330 RepID=A0A1A9ASY3_PLAOA|nr:PIR Superfamily Protein [Plasmodium ovale wallikeri]SBT59377.1 PIR Superfamily Protein [Plasmodium ovale wallikeri]SBT73491.1 PIR protein [Plasmodium ovale]
MPGPKVDSVLKSLKEDHTFKNNQDIQKFYNKLERTCDNNFSHPCIKAIPIKEEIKENVKTFYHKISENQSKLLLIKDNFSVFKGELSKRCMYFKYWFYDQVITNGFDNKQIEQIFKLFDGLNKKIEFYIAHQHDNNGFTDSADSPLFPCKICYFNLDQIKKLKLSLDYIENYDKTKNTSTISKVICNSEYKDYINEIIELCNSKSGDSYQQSKYLCDELDEFKNIHDINELFKMQCNAEHESLYGDLQARFPLPTTNLNMNRTISASLSTVALFGIFSFLYKLTPFGPWIRNHVLSTRKSLFKANEENSEELPENLLDYVDTNSQRDNHNIGYNAV